MELYFTALLIKINYLIVLPTVVAYAFRKNIIYLLLSDNYNVYILSDDYNWNMSLILCTMTVVVEYICLCVSFLLF